MTPAPKPWRYRNLVTVLLLMIAAWAFYFPSAHYGWVYFDDIRILKDHPELYGQPHLGGDLKAIFVTSYPREEPLPVRDVAWAFDSRIFGFGNALGYHLENILLHGVVVALVFVFLLMTTARYGFALATALAYLLLAVHTEPVSWIMGSKDILSTLFMLLALCAQTRRLTTTGTAARSAWYALTLLCFVVALLSKISVLTFPLVLFLQAILFPYLRGERPPNARLTLEPAVVREFLLFIPCLAISGGIYIWYQRTLAQMGLFDRGYTAHGLAHLWNLLLNNSMGFWLYLRQIFFPWHLSLLYTWPALQPSYPAWQIAAAFATAAAIIATGVWLFCRHKDLFFYYATFFVLMVPYLNLVYIGIWVADRYVYFSSFCILAIAITAISTAFRNGTSLIRVGALIICILFAGINLFQKLSYEPAWRNGETLWLYHITLSEPGHVAYENLAAYYYADFSEAHENGNMPEMVLSLRKMEAVVDAALTKFWPDRQQSPPPETSYLFFLQSLVQQVEGKPDAALQSLLISDRLHPGFDSTNLNLAELYRQLAASTQTPQQRQIYLNDALDRLQNYITLEFRGRPAPPEIQKELTELQTECAKPPPPTNGGKSTQD